MREHINHQVANFLYIQFKAIYPIKESMTARILPKPTMVVDNNITT